MSVLDINTIIQAGGVLAFAVMVYLQLKEQTKIMRETSQSIIKIMERQDVIMARQEAMRRNLEQHHIRTKEFPETGLTG